MTEAEPHKGVPPGGRLLRLAGIVLLLGLLVGLFFWTGLAQSWQLRLTATSTTATIHITGTCVADDDMLNTYAYDFTDLASGQHYTLIDPNSCTDLYHDGQVVQLWYTLGQQSHVLTDVAAQQLYWMSAVAAVLALVLVGLLLRQLVLFGLQVRRHPPARELVQTRSTGMGSQEGADCHHQQSGSALPG